jgi:hypothetical protein
VGERRLTDGTTAGFEAEILDESADSRLELTLLNGQGMSKHICAPAIRLDPPIAQFEQVILHADTVNTVGPYVQSTFDNSR